LKDGTVAFTCATESDHNLIDYLKREQVLVDTDSRRLMRRMNLLITNKDNLEVLLQRRRNGAGGIFLSYKSEDFNNVYRWFTKLTAKRFNVWLDHKALHTWDEYNEKIKESIDACPIFMPILTQAVAEDLRNRAENTSFLKPGDEGYHFYIDEEWRHAIESKKQIRPVIIGAYDYRCSEYHNRFKKLMNLSANDISLKSADTDDANIIDDLTTIVTQMH
jgi:transposase